MKLADAELELESLARTICEPAAEAGTVKLQVNEPEPEAVTVDGDVVIVVPS